MEAAQLADLLEVVTERDRRCVLHGESCSEFHDPHHIITQQTLRRYIKEPEQLERALREPRNVVLLCRKHHKAIHAAAVRLPEVAYPEGFYDFLEEFDLKDIWDGIRARWLPTHRRSNV